MEDPTNSQDDGQSPCVRAYVENFERRDSSSGNISENRPSVMTKSKVKQLKESLGRPSDSTKRVPVEDLAKSSDTSAKVGAGTKNSEDQETEHTVSVSKIRENLQKSATEKHIAPWGIVGGGRPVKETKKLSQKRPSDVGIVSDAKSNESPRARSNNSFKQAKQNLIHTPSSSRDKGQQQTRNRLVDDVSNNLAKSSRSDSMPSLFTGSEIQINRSSCGDENRSSGRHKTAPKVLPKPAVRKSKLKLTSGSHQDSSNPVQGNKTESNEVVQKNSVRYDRTHSEEVSCGEVNRNSAPAGDADYTSADLGSTAHDSTVRSSATDDDDSADVDDASNVTKTDEAHFSDDVKSSLPSGFRVNSGIRGISSEPVTNLRTNDGESVEDNDHLSMTHNESLVESGGHKSEFSVFGQTHCNNSVFSEHESNFSATLHNGCPETNKPNEGITSDSVVSCSETPSRDDAGFVLCSESELLLQLSEFGWLTAEEDEYESLAALVCSKMCEEEDDDLRWVLCPPENYKSAVDYIVELFKDINIGQKKSSLMSVEDPLFMSFDSLRETLLDRATKKLECLRVQSGKVNELLVQQDQLEDTLNEVVKHKVEVRHYKKYRTTIEEFDKVLQLLLMLSGRMATTDNLLEQISFSERGQEKEKLISKRDHLIGKYQEARTIKENIEGRRMQVADHLRRCLAVKEFSAYQELLIMKCQLKLLKQSLDDRIALAEQQIKMIVALIEKKTSARYC